VSEKVSLLVTDEWTGYRHVGQVYPHHIIKHTGGEYVVGAIHTQTIEGFWSIFKRGIVGTFHKVSKKYMALYVAEFQFRYNNRHNPDIFAAAIRIEPRREIAAGKARAQLVIVLPLNRAFRRRPCARTPR
jgi:hypothetical protein